jgi:hypothetical protein
MEELLKMVSEKAGIPTDKANTAIQTVIGFLKDKMPGGIGTQVESFIKGGGMSDLAGGIKDKIGNIL